MENTYSYLEFFNLEKPPFTLAPDPLFFYPSKGHLQILEILKYVLTEAPALAIITGGTGLGKTSIIKVLVEDLKRKNDHIAILSIFNPDLKPTEFYLAICKSLNLKNLTPPLKESILREIAQLLKDTEKRFLLIIDEAQLIPEETFEAIRLLTNLSLEAENKLQILLVGQPSLEFKLKSTKFTQFLQRVNLWEKIKPLERNELLNYVLFRVSRAGQNPVVNIEKSIEKSLYKYTGGVPRLINKLMDRALLTAYAKKSETITPKILKLAYKSFPQELLSKDNHLKEVSFLKRIFWNIG